MTGWQAVLPDAAAPLAGLRVLDLSELLPGPFMTQSLAELGADVIKVERPPLGDPVRRSAPGLFAAVNRGKRSLLVDLKSAAGQAQVLALADEADVLVESFRPGVINRLGLDWDTLQQRNPRLVLASLSGYGAVGPRALWPGHDINYLAAAGVLGMAMPAETTAVTFGVPVADLAGATYALAAVQAALLQRARTGRGQHLDVSLTDCAAHWMNVRLAALHDAGGDASLARRRVQQRPGYGVFRCRDGMALTVAALEDHFWQALVAVLPLPAFAGDAWALYRDRVPQAGAINAAIAAALSTEPGPAALQRLAAADVPVAEVVALEALSQTPNLAARGLYAATAVGPLARFPVPLRGVELEAASRAAPAVGEDGVGPVCAARRNDAARHDTT